MINSLELKKYLTEAVRNVFDTMLSMSVDTVSAGGHAQFNGGHIVGSVSFAGVVSGNVNLHVDKKFARLMTAAILSLETDEIEGDEETHDVIGEVCNMIAGDLKSRLCDLGLICELSIPSITSGREFTVESKGWERCERFGFKTSQHIAKVEVFMKNGK